jgi:hypothetical protein
LLTQIDFTFSLINSLHTAVTTRLKLPSCLFIAISFVQQITILSPVCFSSISARHSILSTILFYCLYSISDSLTLIQLSTDFSLTLPTVHIPSSLLVIRLFRLWLIVVWYATGLGSTSVPVPLLCRRYLHCLRPPQCSASHIR